MQAKTKNAFEWLKLNFGSCLSWAITFAWLIFIFCKIRNGILPKDLNAFGDFIAGAFAPLAFFWLVRGFYQQGKGLEQNSEALNLQASELEKSTKALELQIVEMKLALEQQTVLADSTKEHLILSKQTFEHQLNVQNINSQPSFHLSVSSVVDTKPLTLDLSLSNSGKQCRDVNIFFKDIFGELTLKINQFDLILGDSRQNYIIESLVIPQSIRFDENSHISLIMKIWYEDNLDKAQFQEFTLIIASDLKSSYEVKIHKIRSV